MASDQAKEPFRFSTRFHLTESTGLKAANIEQLLALLREVPGSCMYHHTHRSLQQHEYLSPEPPNDFAFWLANALGEEELGERVASIDIIQFGTIRELREQIIATIEAYLASRPETARRSAPSGREFYFLKSVSFVAPTPYVAHTLEEFAEMLGKVTLDSVYFHIFEARLRLENRDNDFSNWIETSLDDRDMARAISRLDPYTYALEDLRQAVMRIVRKKGGR